jgi:predicted small lipoprotein YifL
MRILLAILVFALSACGQKGDLYLREKPPPGYKPKVEPYKPVPYPDAGEHDAGAAK